MIANLETYPPLVVTNLSFEHTLRLLESQFLPITKGIKSLYQEHLLGGHQ